MVKMEVIDVIAFFFATQLYLNFIFFCKIQASAFFSSQHFFVVGLCSGCVWFAAFGLGVFSPPKSHSGGGDPALCSQGSGTRGAPPPPSPPPWTARRRCWRAATTASWPEPCFGRVLLCPPWGCCACVVSRFVHSYPTARAFCRCIGCLDTAPTGRSPSRVLRAELRVASRSSGLARMGPVEGNCVSPALDAQRTLLRRGPGGGVG